MNTTPQYPESNGIPQKYLKNLAAYVTIALLLGIAVGHYYPEKGIQLDFLGSGFLYLIEPLIQPIIFLTIIIGVSSIGNLKKVGRVGLKAFVYFEIITTIAMIMGIMAALFIEPGKIEKRLIDVTLPKHFTATESLDNGWFNFIVLNRPLVLLLLAVITGVLLSLSPGRAKYVGILQKIMTFLYRILLYLFLLIPVAAFGGMAYAVSRFGIHSLLPLGKLLATTYITMASFVFIVLGLLLRYYNISLWKFLNYIKEELLIVFSTSSSRTVFPLIVAKLEQAGCSKAVVGLSIPLGYSFNLAGASVFLPICTLFVAQLFNIPLTFRDIITIGLVIMVTSKVASGIPGSGFVALTITFTTLNKFPLEGLALLFSIDKFMNEARTITNFIGNGVAVILISKYENEFEPNPEIDLSITK
ncbi:cation:dicarboxylate symporter family transporter [Flavobacterium sp. N502540]|uniref:cation:dicarboxylate symporter family transporter n=1 Tax=Flavobacterium sp. N502540 TaxID=2986838 RepID=UPI0022252AAB|nr:cation:dicarboxylase symporter family transporter [Flavobacterium sp. N502540]